MDHKLVNKALDDRAFQYDITSVVEHKAKGVMDALTCHHVYSALKLGVGLISNDVDDATLRATRNSTYAEPEEN